MTRHPSIALQDIPSGSWDSHCHTFDPAKYPYVPDTPYLPPACSTEQLLEAVPCSNFCIVMAMPEGVDPALALESVAKIAKLPGRTARATVVLDFDTVTDDQLRELHAQGVSSVRIHAKGAITQHLSGNDALKDYIRQVAKRIAPLGWSLDGQLKTAQWVNLAPTIRDVHREFGTTFVADHCFYLGPDTFGSPDWETCLSLVEDGIVYVKISGLDQNVDNNDLERMREVVEGLVAAHNGERCLFGSDWPHVIPGDMQGNLMPIDSKHELAYLLQWLGKKAFQKLMVENPLRLYG